MIILILQEVISNFNLHDQLGTSVDLDAILKELTCFSC